MIANTDLSCLTTTLSMDGVGSKLDLTKSNSIKTS
jgi:hypothetical protein